MDWMPLDGMRQETGDGRIVPVSSTEGRRVLRKIYGHNAENVESYGSIYAPDGSFYIG